jgi:hypothetical protein
MSTQTEAMKRWVEVFDGNWHDEPVDSEWADRAHQALAEMRQAIAEAEQPAQQEPVAVVSGYYGGQCVILPINPARIFNSNTALYTSPPAQRKPLTDEQIVAKALHLSGLGTSPDVIQFARAIEAAHGITKGNT